MIGSKTTIRFLIRGERKIICCVGGEKIAEKSCDIKGCENTFPQKATGRLRITKKKHKGELVAWICPSHGKDIESKIEWRGD